MDLNIVYPQKCTSDILDTVPNSFSDNTFVKINTFCKSNCIYDSFLMAGYMQFQNEKDLKKRKKIKNDFKQNLINYLTKSGELTSQDCYNKIFDAFERSKYTHKYSLTNSDRKFTIYDIMVVSKEDKEKKFFLFNKEMRKKIPIDSNFFNVINLELLKEIIEHKICLEEYKYYLKQLEEDEDYDKMEDVEEIINFMELEENNMNPENLMKLLSLKNKSHSDLVLKIISSVFDINILLCRPWNKEITVINKFEYNKENNYIIIFKISGEVSLTGEHINICYETGGYIHSNAIKTILNYENDKEVLDTIDKLYENNTESYYMEKYLSYLQKLRNNHDLENLSMFYNLDEDSSSSEEEDEEEEEEKEEEEEIMTREEEVEREPEVNLNIEVPQFIKGYTKPELVKLLLIFLGNKYKYENISKEKLELLYAEFLENKFA